MPSVLIVEDDKVAQKVALHVLSGWDFEVTVANDGSEAITALKEQHFDIVLMDLFLPGLDGLDIVKLIRASDDAVLRATPIIAYSSSDIADSKEKANMLGMNDFVTKPANAAELHFKISQHVSRKVADRPVNINVELFGESDLSFMGELTALMISNLRELQLALLKAYYSGNKQVLLSALHKTKSTMVLLNDREFNSILQEVKEAFVTNSSQDLLKQTIKKFTGITDSIIRNLSSTSEHQPTTI